MPRQASRRQYRALAAIGGLGMLTANACLHDWEPWLPETGTATVSGSGTGTATGGGTGAGTGTPSGQGGDPGQIVPGTCPTISGTTELIKVGTINVTATCVDVTEVTKGQYRDWLPTSPSPSSLPVFCSWKSDFIPQDSPWPPDAADASLPVIGVDWCDAYAYCLGVGKRLCGDISTSGGNVLPSDFNNPYSSEWHNACTNRGQSSYPYGGEYDEDACNGSDAGHSGAVDVGTMTGCATPAGVLDMSGNIWEWEYSCSGELGQTDLCKTRGGGWNSFNQDLICAKDAPTPRNHRSTSVGFRCCADAEL